MQRKALRATVGAADVDIPIGTFTAGQNLRFDGTQITTAAGGAGDVVGPGSATDNAIARFDLATGKLIQNSAVTIADTTGNIVQPAGGLLNGVDVTNLDARLNPGGADTMFTGTYAAGDVAEWSGAQWDPKFSGVGFNTATQVAAVIALADVTGHTFALPRAGTYAFKFRGAYRSNATTTGLRFSANYSGTTTTYNGGMEVTTGAAGAVGYFAQTTLNTAMGSGTGPGAVDVGFEFWGRIVVSTSGTFAFRIASEVAVASGITLAIGALSEISQL